MVDVDYNEKGFDRLDIAKGVAML